MKKLIQQLKAGDIVHAHGGVFRVIEDARESGAHRPMASHLKTVAGPSDCAVATAECIDGYVTGYFWPGSTWVFQGNQKAGELTVEE